MNAVFIKHNVFVKHLIFFFFFFSKLVILSAVINPTSSCLNNSQ